MTMNEIKKQLKKVAVLYYGVYGLDQDSKFEKSKAVGLLIEKSDVEIQDQIIDFIGKEKLTEAFELMWKKLTIYSHLRTEQEKRLYMCELQRYGTYTMKIVNFVGLIVLEVFSGVIKWEQRN